METGTSMEWQVRDPPRPEYNKSQSFLDQREVEILIVSGAGRRRSGVRRVVFQVQLAGVLSVCEISDLYSL